MQPCIEVCKVVFRNGLSCESPLGGSIDVGLLGENHHKFNLIVGESLLSNEGFVHLFVNHFLHRLVEWIDP